MADDNFNVRCINKGRPVYFSYARNSIKKPEWEHISDCVDKVLELFELQTGPHSGSRYMGVNRFCIVC